LFVARPTGARVLLVALPLGVSPGPGLGARLGCLWAYQRGVLRVFLGVLGVGWGFFLLGDAV
jgi:hypothetical protein